MTIDNRFFLPLIGPFIIFSLARLLWAAMGVPWHPDSVGATFILLVGGGGGFVSMLLLFAERISIGNLKIGGKA